MKQFDEAQSILNSKHRIKLEQIEGRFKIKKQREFKASINLTNLQKKAKGLIKMKDYEQASLYYEKVRHQQAEENRLWS